MTCSIARWSRRLSTQFCLLFSVLMQAEDLEQGMVRFQRGLTKLLNTGTAVAEVIRTMENG